MLYKTGAEQGEKDLKIFNYPQNLNVVVKASFSYNDTIFPIYNNQTCNEFSFFVNYVKFRNDKTVTNWLKQVYSQQFHHPAFSNDDSLNSVEEYLDVIDHY